MARRQLKKTTSHALLDHISSHSKDDDVILLSSLEGGRRDNNIVIIEGEEEGGEERAKEELQMSLASIFSKTPSEVFSRTPSAAFSLAHNQSSTLSLMSQFEELGIDCNTDDSNENDGGRDGLASNSTTSIIDDNRVVRYAKVLVLAALFGTAAICTGATYLVSLRGEEATFQARVSLPLLLL